MPLTILEPKSVPATPFSKKAKSKRSRDANLPTNTAEIKNSDRESLSDWIDAS